MNRTLEKRYIEYFQKQFADDADSFSISGSQAAGLATSTSDTDLVLLVKDASPLRSKVGEFFVDFVDHQLLFFDIHRVMQIENVSRLPQEL